MIKRYNNYFEIEKLSRRIINSNLSLIANAYNSDQVNTQLTSQTPIVPTMLSLILINCQNNISEGSRVEELRSLVEYEYDLLCAEGSRFFLLSVYWFELWF